VDKLKKDMVSVIVPSVERGGTIEKCLESLRDQDYKGKYEVVVVYNTKHLGPAHTRNEGARRARGGILLFTDADCVAPRNWIRMMVRNLKGEVVGVGGVYKNLNKDFLVSRYIQNEVEYRQKDFVRETDSIGTLSAAYRRDIFLEFGGFDKSFAEASGEDFDLSYTLKEAGYKLITEPKAYVWHSHVKTLKEYLIQQYGRAYWRVFLYKKHPKKIIKDNYTGYLLPLFAVFMTLFWLTLPLAILFSLYYLPLIFLLGFYFLNSRFILYIAKKELKMLLAAPIIIFLRTNIGLLGFIMGKVRF